MYAQHIFSYGKGQHRTKPTIRRATSEVSDQPMHLCSLIRVFTDHMFLLQPPGYPERDKRELLLYWVDVQVDLCLSWSHRSYCRFCQALANIFPWVSFSYQVL